MSSLQSTNFINRKWSYCYSRQEERTLFKLMKDLGLKCLFPREIRHSCTERKVRQAIQKCFYEYNWTVLQVPVLLIAPDAYSVGDASNPQYHTYPVHTARILRVDFIVNKTYGQVIANKIDKTLRPQEHWRGTTLTFLNKKTYKSIFGPWLFSLIAPDKSLIHKNWSKNNRPLFKGTVSPVQTCLCHSKATSTDMCRLMEQHLQ